MSKDVLENSLIAQAWLTAVHSDQQIRRLYASGIYRNPPFTVSKLETAMRGFPWDTILVETPPSHEHSHSINR